MDGLLWKIKEDEVFLLLLQSLLKVCISNLLKVRRSTSQRIYKDDENNVILWRLGEKIFKYIDFQTNLLPREQIYFLFLSFSFLDIQTGFPAVFSFLVIPVHLNGAFFSGKNDVTTEGQKPK